MEQCRGSRLLGSLDFRFGQLVVQSRLPIGSIVVPFGDYRFWILNMNHREPPRSLCRLIGEPDSETLGLFFLGFLL